MNNLSKDVQDDIAWNQNRIHALENEAKLLAQDGNKDAAVLIRAAIRLVQDDIKELENGER